MTKPDLKPVKPDWERIERALEGTVMVLDSVSRFVGGMRHLSQHLKKPEPENQQHSVDL